MRQELRDLILFAPHSLLKDPPFSKIDLLTCRNVLIYLQQDIQQQIFELFHYAMRPAAICPGFGGNNGRLTLFP